MSGDADPWRHMSSVFLGVTVAVFGYGPLAGSMTIPHTGESLTVIIGITVIGTVLPLVVFTAGLARIEASRASLLGTTEPLTTMLLGVVLLPKAMMVTVGLGALLITGSVIPITGLAERLLAPWGVRTRPARRILTSHE